MWWRRRKQDQQLTAPKNNDVDWREVAAGLWPELKTTQLIMRAALRDHRGPAVLCFAVPHPWTALRPLRKKTCRRK
jgi:hypothetical protein